MDLREKKSIWFGIAEFTLRLRWIWIISILVVMGRQAFNNTETLMQFLSEVAMQHQFTLQFMVRHPGTLNDLFIEVMSLGLPFIIPICAVFFMGTALKYRWGLIAFPLVFLTLWQFFFLKSELQSQYFFTLLGLGILGIALIYAGQYLGALILPTILLTFIVLVWNLGFASLIGISALQEFHWNIELLVSIFIVDCLIYGATAVVAMQKGRPKLAALVNTSEKFIPYLIVRHAIMFGASAIWINQTLPTYLRPILVAQAAFLLTSLLLVLLVFPSLLSILPFKTIKKGIVV